MRERAAGVFGMLWGSTSPKLSCGRPGPGSSCSSSLCRARILFLLQLLADHVPGIGLVASKCGMGV